LDAEERIYLFCIASGTSTAKAPGNTAAIHTRLNCIPGVGPLPFNDIEAGSLGKEGLSLA
jgi:hypothetical protein